MIPFHGQPSKTRPKFQSKEGPSKGSRFNDIWLIFMVNVGKYTSPMDGMGTMDSCEHLVMILGWFQSTVWVWIIIPFWVGSVFHGSIWNVHSNTQAPWFVVWSFFSLAHVWILLFNIRVKTKGSKCTWNPLMTLVLVGKGWLSKIEVLHVGF